MPLFSSRHKSLPSLPPLLCNRVLVMQDSKPPFPFQSSLWKRGELVSLTVLLKGSGCLGVTCRAEGGPSTTLCFLKNSTAEPQVFARRPEVWEGFRNPCPSLCCRYLPVCTMHLWAPSRCATTKGMSLRGDRQHRRHLLLPIPLSLSCTR